MKQLIIAAFLITAAQSFGQSSFGVTNITTTKGVQYRGVKVMHVDPDGLCISYSDKSGSLYVTKVRFDVLPEQVQKQFGYDPAKSDDFKLEQQQAKQNWSDKLNNDELIAKKEQAQREHEYWVQEQAAIKAAKEEEERQLQRDFVKAQQQQADAQQRQADAAIIQAVAPPSQTIYVHPSY